MHVPGPAPPPHDPNEVRTIFISGFPDDVKERELNNLLRFLPGYEVRVNSICAFASWSAV